MSTNELGIYLPEISDLKNLIVDRLKSQGFIIEDEEINLTIGAYNVFQIEVGVKHDDISKLLSKDLKSHDLSITTMSKLEKKNVENLANLLNYSEKDLREVIGLGQTSISELKKLLPSPYKIKFKD